MIEHLEHSSSARLLLFERDPLKRHYFQKYVLGIIWRGLSEEEQQQRLAEVLERRRARSEGAPPDTPKGYL